MLRYRIQVRFFLLASPTRRDVRIGALGVLYRRRRRDDGHRIGIDCPSDGRGGRARRLEPGSSRATLISPDPTTAARSSPMRRSDSYTAAFLPCGGLGDPPWVAVRGLLPQATSRIGPSRPSAGEPTAMVGRDRLTATADGYGVVARRSLWRLVRRRPRGGRRQSTGRLAERVLAERLLSGNGAVELRSGSVELRSPSFGAAIGWSISPRRRDRLAGLIENSLPTNGSLGT